MGNEQGVDHFGPKDGEKIAQGVHKLSQLEGNYTFELLFPELTFLRVFTTQITSLGFILSRFQRKGFYSVTVLGKIIQQQS